MPLSPLFSMCLPCANSGPTSSDASETVLLLDGAEDPPPPLDAPTKDMTLWSKSESRAWLCMIQNAQQLVRHGKGRKTEGLDPYFAQRMSRALACLRTDLLLPDEVATRDIALDLLRTAPPDRRIFGCGHWRITREQGQQLRDAIGLGHAILATGPRGHRRTRSSAELAGLRDLVRWAGDGGDRQQRAAFVAALRAPERDGGDATVRWHESAACEGGTGPLDMPPRRMIAALTGRDRTSLLWQTHSFQIDDPQRFAESIAAFDGVILQPTRLPSAESAQRLPRGITALDVTELQPPLAWSDVEPMTRGRPELRRVTYFSWQLPDEVPATLEGLCSTLQAQIQDSNRQGLQQDSAPRLQRIADAVRQQPELLEGVQAALHRDPGHCLDANLMRLEEIEALVDAGQAPRAPADRALFFFRQALKWRAHQTAASQEQKDEENLEIGHGLAWAIDQRLVDLLGVSPSATEPVYQRLARLPGAVPKGKPVNDAHAADAVIAAEIRGEFPALAFIAAGGHPLSASMNDALDEDPGFVGKRQAIDGAFQRAYTEAFNLAPDDPDAGTEAFRKKEEDVIRARVDRLAHHLRPALAKLRAAGIAIDASDDPDMPAPA